MRTHDYYPPLPSTPLLTSVLPTCKTFLINDTRSLTD